VWSDCSVGACGGEFGAEGFEFGRGRVVGTRFDQDGIGDFSQLEGFRERLDAFDAFPPPPCVTKAAYGLSVIDPCVG